LGLAAGEKIVDAESLHPHWQAPSYSIMVVLTQGFGCCAAFTLGWAALRFQRLIDVPALRGRNFDSRFRLHSTTSSSASLYVLSWHNQLIGFNEDNSQ
jgi:hypothetical protein